uniref:ATPase family AAA domain-containing protein 5 n=1 Tax=Parastrongyloides trichosuri TaxID=131310 RepID=A0A0N4ZNZ1_PARTI
MSDNSKTSSFGNDSLINKREIINKKKRGRPPTKLLNNETKKCAKNNSSSIRILSSIKKSKLDGIKQLKWAKLKNSHKKTNVISKHNNISTEKKKRGRPRKIPISSSDEINSTQHFENSLLNLMKQDDNESEKDFYLNNDECQTESTLQAQNKLLNLLQRPPAFIDYETVNKKDGDFNQKRKLGRPKKIDIKNCLDEKTEKLEDISLEKNISLKNENSNNKLTTNNVKKTKICDLVKINENKSSMSKNFGGKFKKRLQNINQGEISTSIHVNGIISTICENGTHDNGVDQTEKNSNQCVGLNNDSHTTEKALTNLFKNNTSIPQTIEKRKRGRPRGSIGKNKLDNNFLSCPTNDNIMEKILGSFPNEIPHKKKRGRPRKEKLLEISTNNSIKNEDNSDIDSPPFNNLGLQELINQKIEILSQNFDSKNCNYNLSEDILSNTNKMVKEKDDTCKESTSSEIKDINEPKIIVTLSSDGTYTISGDLPKMPKTLICNAFIKNISTNESTKMPMQLIINNQGETSNSEMTPNTLSPENLSRSESTSFGSNSNNLISGISTKSNNCQSNTQDSIEEIIKNNDPSDFFEDQREESSSESIQNEPTLSNRQFINVTNGSLEYEKSNDFLLLNNQFIEKNTRASSLPVSDNITKNKDGAPTDGNI